MSKPMSQNLFTATTFNRLVFLAALSGLVGSFVLILNFDTSQFSFWQLGFASVSFVLINSIFLHSLFNIVHLSTHTLLGKKFWVNRLYGNIAAFFGGITFSDFYTTHLLHHANQGNPEKDPDHWITRSGSIWSIPFKIMYHDVWFWKNSLYKKRLLWLDYLITRVLQASLIIALALTGNVLILLIFWLVPMAIVGYMNSLFLFYYPHYTTKLEVEIKNQSHPSLLGKSLLEAIDIARISHEIHHDRVRNNQVYYPISWSIWHKFQGSWAQIKTDAKLKYTEFGV